MCEDETVKKKENWCDWPARGGLSGLAGGDYGMEATLSRMSAELDLIPPTYVRERRFLLGESRVLLDQSRFLWHESRLLLDQSR